MKIIILGADSILGSALCNILQINHTLYKAGRKHNNDIIFDLSLNNQLKNIPEADVFINCASAFADDTIKGFQINLQVNVVGISETMKLVMAAQVKKYIYISSIFAYNEKENEYRETSYGISKKYAEDIVITMCKGQNIDYLCLRLAQLYDKKSCEKIHQPFLYHLIEKVEESSNIIIYGKKDCERNYIFLDDAVQIIAACAEKQIYGLYPLASLETMKISQMIQVISEIYERNIEMIFDKTKPDIRTIYYPKNIENLYIQLSIRPSTLFRDGIWMIKDYRDAIHNSVLYK